MAKDLILKDGIYQAPEEAKISYPKEASDEYFKIEENSFWFRHRNNCLVEMIKRFPPSGEIYDVGGGNGCVAANLEKNGFPAVLIEPNMAGALNAKKRGLKTVFCATIKETNLPKNSLAAIGIFDVLEHIENDRSFLTELGEYLKIGGRLYVTVPAYNFLWSADDEYAGHFRRYSLGSLAEILKEAGFKVDYSTYLFNFLPWPIFFLKSLPHRMGLSKERAVSAAKDHEKNNFFLDGILAWESARIKNGGKIPFGSSCLAAATKIFS